MDLASRSGNWASRASSLLRASAHFGFRMWPLLTPRVYASASRGTSGGTSQIHRVLCFPRILPIRDVFQRRDLSLAVPTQTMTRQVQRGRMTPMFLSLLFYVQKYLSTGLGESDSNI